MLNPKEAYHQAAPIQYENKRGILEESGEYISYWGKKVLISGGKLALKSSLNKIEEGLSSQGLDWETHTFVGECCDENINKIAQKAKIYNSDIILGVGGGKAIDSAKVAAERAGCYLAAVPTLASTCAAASSLSIVYSKEGYFERSHYLPSHPVLVMIDPLIIAKAPVKYLKSGIIDGLSKWYEGKAVFSGLKNPDLYSQSAMHLSKLLKQEIEEKSFLAVKACEENKVNQSLIKVIDINVYLTGLIQSLGHKTCRGAAAHSIHNGMTVMKESHEVLHGIKVAYGIIVQLFLENKSEEDINEVINFMKKLDVIPSLKGLGLPNDSGMLRKIAEKAVSDEVMQKMPEKIEIDDILNAMKNVEEFV